MTAAMGVKDESGRTVLRHRRDRFSRHDFGLGSGCDANLKAGADGWVWTEEKMMEYLLNPRAAMPGNKMAFAGLKDEQDRKDLIAYLKQFSK